MKIFILILVFGSVFYSCSTTEKGGRGPSSIQTPIEPITFDYSRDVYRAPASVEVSDSNFRAPATVNELNSKALAIYAYIIDAKKFMPTTCTEYTTGVINDFFLSGVDNFLPNKKEEDRGPASSSSTISKTVNNIQSKLMEFKKRKDIAADCISSIDEALANAQLMESFIES